MSLLFEPKKLGNILLSNRIVMAPMTRSRALNNIPNDLMVKYYGDRASAGLIITEGTSPSPNGLRYPRLPGLFNMEQVEAWKKVTTRVHDQGGRIFVQLMHNGRTSHAFNMAAGTQILAPSAVQQTGKIHTDNTGNVDYPIPKEMTLEDIQMTKNEFIQSAQLAIEAGFDGVELHAANGYLLEQFLNPKINHRTDSYGGSDEGRMRFVLEVAEGAVKKIGADKVGIRISPYGVMNETGAFDGIDSFYTKFSKAISDLKLVYVHVVDHSNMGTPPVSPELKRAIRDNFKGTYILSGGYDVAKAETDLKE